MSLAENEVGTRPYLLTSGVWNEFGGSWRTFGQNGQEKKNRIRVLNLEGSISKVCREKHWREKETQGKRSVGRLLP